MMYTEEMEAILKEHDYSVHFFCNGDECDIFHQGRYIETLEGGTYTLYNWMCERELLV